MAETHQGGRAAVRGNAAFTVIRQGTPVPTFGERIRRIIGRGDEDEDEVTSWEQYRTTSRGSRHGQNPTEHSG